MFMRNIHFSPFFARIINLALFLRLLIPANGESPSCPCIDTATWPTDIGRNASGLPCLLFSDLNCVPSHYGVGECKAWDALLNADCIGKTGNERGAWCDEPFCYVNTTACVTKQTGKSYHQTDLIVGGEGLAYYSYETCGGDGSSWKSSLLESSIKGKELRVGVPKSFYPEQFMIDGNGNALPDGLYIEGTPLRGVWVEYLEEMMELSPVEFTVKFLPVSNSSMKDHSSLWTACAQDVANGVVDMCIGNFWVTADRISLGVDFATPATSDTFKLLSKLQSQDPPWSERLWSPFAPFSSGLWISICCTFILVGLLYALIGNSNEFGGNEGSSEESVTKTSWLQKKALRKSMKMIYFATMEFASAGVEYEASDGIRKKMSLRIIKAGYALFIIVTVSCYVGNMAAMRLAERVSGSINSPKDCAEDPSCTMCIHSVTESYFNEKYPSLNTYKSSSSKNLVLDLLDGKCTVSMSQGLHFGALGEDVNKLRVCEYYYDTDVYNMYVSQPVGKSFRQALSQLSVSVKDTGKYYDLYDKYFSSHERLCADTPAYVQQGDTNDEGTFDFEDFGGLYIIMLTLFGIGIINDFMQHHHIKYEIEKWITREKAKGVKNPELSEDAKRVARRLSTVVKPQQSMRSIHRTTDEKVEGLQREMVKISQKLDDLSGANI